MSIYKITNISQLAGKRDVKYNSTIGIEYIDEMVKKTISIKPNETIYLTVSSLPLSVHRLRIKNLITVSEISMSELNKLIGDVKSSIIKTKNLVDDGEKNPQKLQVQTSKKKFNKKEENIDKKNESIDY